MLCESCLWTNIFALVMVSMYGYACVHTIYRTLCLHSAIGSVVPHTGTVFRNQHSCIQMETEPMVYSWFRIQLNTVYSFSVWFRKVPWFHAPPGPEAKDEALAERKALAWSLVS